MSESEQDVGDGTDEREPASSDAPTAPVAGELRVRKNGSTKKRARTAAAAAARANRPASR